MQFRYISFFFIFFSTFLYGQNVPFMEDFTSNTNFVLPSDGFQIVDGQSHSPSLSVKGKGVDYKIDYNLESIVYSVNFILL